MKIEISNKDLEQDLINLAEANYLDPAQFTKQILEQYVEANSKEPSDRIDTSISNVKNEAKKLQTNICSMLYKFETRYGVKVKLVEGLADRYALDIRI